MPIHILIRKKKWALPTADLHHKAALILESVGLSALELSLLFTEDGEMKDLNRQYRGKDKTTDVLSFPQSDGGKAPDEAHGLLGDVVISVDTAQRQANEYGVTLTEEIDRLLIHGILHLAGYDHETSTTDAKKMRAKEESLIKKLGE